MKLIMQSENTGNEKKINNREKDILQVHSIFICTCIYNVLKSIFLYTAIIWTWLRFWVFCRLSSCWLSCYWSVRSLPPEASWRMLTTTWHWICRCSLYPVWEIRHLVNENVFKGNKNEKNITKHCFNNWHIILLILVYAIYSISLPNQVVRPSKLPKTFTISPC